LKRTPVVAALCLVVTIASSVYAAQMVGVLAHEIVGHGLVAVLVGGTFERFVVDPAAHGYAVFDGVPAGRRWIPTWGGIAVQLVLGVAAMVLSRLRGHAIGHAGLACLAFAITNAGSAIGYALQGVLSGSGDAGHLRHDLGGVPRIALALALFGAYLALLDWTLRRLMPLLDAQAGAPPSIGRRRAWFLWTGALPVAALKLARPPSTVFEPVMDWVSRLVILSAIVLVGLWRVRTVPRGAVTERPPFGVVGAAAWAAFALLLGVLAATWWTHGVVVR